MHCTFVVYSFRSILYHWYNCEVDQFSERWTINDRWIYRWFVVTKIVKYCKSFERQILFQFDCHVDRRWILERSERNESRRLEWLYQTRMLQIYPSLTSKSSLLQNRKFAIKETEPRAMLTKATLQRDPPRAVGLAKLTGRCSTKRD